MKKNVLLILGIIFLGVFVGVKFEISNLISVVLEKISLLLYILLCFSITGQLLFRSIRFRLLLNNQRGDNISFRDSFLLSSASYFVAFATPNKVGDTLRGVFLKSQRLQVTAISILEYLMDVFITASLPVLGLLILNKPYSTSILIGYAFLAVGLIVLFISTRVLRFNNLFQNFRFFRNLKDKIRLVKNFFVESLENRNSLFWGLLLSYLIYSVYLGIFFVVLHDLGAQITLFETIVSAGIGMFIGAVTFVPMGLGTRDVSTYGILMVLGANQDIAMSSVIIMRSLSLPLILVSGICYFISLKRF